MKRLIWKITGAQRIIDQQAARISTLVSHVADKAFEVDEFRAKATYFEEVLEETTNRLNRQISYLNGQLQGAGEEIDLIREENQSLNNLLSHIQRITMEEE